MSLLARNALRQVARRGTTAPSRFMSSGHPNQVPFAYQNKFTFGAKVASYLIAGFSIPFVAATFQLSKSSGGA